MPKEDPNSINLTVRVIPRSSRSEIVGEEGGILKVKLRAAPVDGAANEELLRILAKHFNARPSDIEIVSGFRSKNKIVRISSITGNR